MPPNSRRVRWLFASNGQQDRACLISLPPVFTDRCRNLAQSRNDAKE
jgi:hypothetical protein